MVTDSCWKTWWICISSTKPVARPVSTVSLILSLMEWGGTKCDSPKLSDSLAEFISLTVLRTKVFFTRNILINSDTLLVIAAGHLFELNRCKLSRSFCQMSCTKFPALPGSLFIFVMLPFFNSPTKPLLAFIGFFNGFGELKKLLDHLRSKLASIT